MTGHTNTPQVEKDCITPIRVIGTNRFALRDFRHNQDYFRCRNKILSSEVFIRKPRT